MTKQSQHLVFKYSLLVLALCVFAGLFLLYNTYGNWEFALPIRGKKLVAFVLVGISTAFGTISFQTLTHNHFLTPSILGLDSLYVVVQTALFFIFGTETIGMFGSHLFMFMINVCLMVGVSTIMFIFLINKGQTDLYLLLMIGLVLGTFLGSGSSFMQVLLDPNEYAILQGKLFASFDNIDTSLLQVASLMILVIIVYLWQQAPKLDVFHLGRDQALSLGVDIKRLQLGVLMAVSTLVAISTALVGPVTFLGFIVANLTYQYLKTYRHRHLFVMGSLMSILLLTVEQFFVEQVFQWQTTMGVVIEFIGGVYFISKILKERKAN